MHISAFVQNKYGLFIGVNRSNDIGIAPRRYAEEDARALADVFKYKFGFETRLLTGEGVREDDICCELEHIGSVITAGDLFVFFFAGHGKTQMPNVFVFNALCALTDRWPGVQRAFIFDTDRVFQENQFGWRRQNTNTDSLLIVNAISVPELSQESPELGHGLFAAALIDEVNKNQEFRRATVINEQFISALAVRMKDLVRQHRLHEKEPILEYKGAPICLFAPTPLDEKSMQIMEERIPALAAVAVEKAYKEALAAGMTVLEAVNDQLVETSANGARRVIKNLPPSHQVEMGSKRTRRMAR